MKDFAEIIREARKARGHSIRSLEKALLDNQRVHASRSFINLMETRKRKPTYEIAYALSQELGIDTKVALRAAYLARAEFDRQREKEYLLKLKKKRRLSDLDIEYITR